MIPRTRVLGIGVDIVNSEELVSRVAQLATQRGSHLVCYVNAECVNRALLDRRYRAILHAADIVYADGMGVVWASRLFGQPLPERVTLGDFLPRLCQRCSEHGYRVFIVAGEPEVAERAAERLQRQFPQLQIVGTSHGYLPAQEDAALIERINRAQPHLLLVGMGVPRQEKWLWQYRQQLRVPVVWGVGALFDYYARKTPRAPVWIRRLGFEWMFRLLVEPRRLWKRYVLGNALFIMRAAALPLFDAVMVTGAWLGVYAARSQLNSFVRVPINAIEPYVRISPLIVGIWLVVSAACGSYRRSTAMSLTAELWQVAQATVFGLLITMAAAFLLKEFDLGRSVILPFGAGTFALLAGSRLIVRWGERQMARQGIGLRRTLIVGTGPLAWRLHNEIEASPIGYDVVGFVSDGEVLPTVSPEDIVGPLGDLGRLIRRLAVGEVFVVSERLKLHEKLNLLTSEEQSLVNFHVVAEELEPFAKHVRISRVASLPVLQLPREKSHAWYEGSKRAFDVLIASAGLLLTCPIMAAIACAIKLSSPGPIVFSQQRTGRKGHGFRMYKFRTMQVGTSPYAVSPNDLRDPRVTPLGRFLRRWSLDELPQLVNVARGEMSLVGPRPEMPFLVDAYEPWQRERLTVSPGLAGLWQIVGRKELPLERNLEYDLYYVRHRGWWLDLMILLRTIPAVLFRRGAF